MKEVKKTHIGSYAIIIRGNKMAVIKKAVGGYKGKYDLPGGGIEHTENPIEALHRECMEEIEATVIKEKLFDVTSTNIKWQMEKDLIEDLHHIGILYMVDIKEDNIKRDADGIDYDGAIWMNIDDITQDNSSPFLWLSLVKLEYK